MKLPHIEVYSFDDGKTFEYVINTACVTISKMNGIIKFSMAESQVSINKKFKYMHSISASTLREFHNLFHSAPYLNKSQSSILFLNFIKTVDAVFNNPKHSDVFKIYNKRNNDLLDTLEGNPLNGVAQNDKKALDRHLFSYLKPELEVLNYK